MKKIANYVVEDKPIGSGGMGQVYRGRDPYGRVVAIKEILPEFVNDEHYHKRIEREIKCLIELNDPYIVKIYEHFQLNGMLYIVMEFVEGMNLEQYIASNGPMSLEDACNVMDKLLGTMNYIHQHHIIHRDLKPSNIMLRPSKQVCVLDFGIAKDTEQNLTEELTLAGTVLGTDGYMSPEQANGYGIDNRTDIYSLGCVFYFMLTGKHAFIKYDGDDFRTQQEILNKPIPRLSESRNDLPPYVQSVLDSATHKNMLCRYRTCLDFQQALMNPANGNSEANGAPKTEDNPNAPHVTEAGAPIAPVVVSVGRENCDISTALDNNKVSRHHCDIELLKDNGAVIYKITDCSRNGTVVNNTHLSKGQSYIVRPGERPAIYLATNPVSMLDWGLVLSTFNKKSGAPVSGPNQPGPNQSGPNQPGGWPPGGWPPGPNPPGPGPWSGYEPESMTFGEAVSSCFNKYAYFNGRASRSEFWYFWLLLFVVNIVLQGLSLAMTGSSAAVFMWIIVMFFGLATFLPMLAVTVRRLHDTDRSGWTFLLSLIPLVGGIILLVYLCQQGTQGHNRYG